MRRRLSGFTLLELGVVVFMVGIVSAIALSRAAPRASQDTAGFQAQLFANDLRHTQMLAMAWGKELRLTPTATSYSVTCVSASGGPCVDTSSPVVDPGHDGPFTVTLQNSVTLSGSALQFDILGKPSAAATFTLSADGAVIATVSVAAVTGFVSVN
jgi:type II secretory pathway pseudopilin PulG